MFAERKNSNPYSSQGMKLLFYCPVCSANYHPLAFKILEETEEAHLVHIECPKCGTLVLALILSSGSSVGSLGLITDLLSAEVGKFRKTGEVAINDVIDLHCLLEKEDSLELIYNY